MTLREYFMKKMYQDLYEKHWRWKEKTIDHEMKIDKNRVYYFVKDIDHLKSRKPRYVDQYVYIRINRTETKAYEFDGGWFVRIVSGTRLEEDLKNLGFVKITDEMLQSEVTPL